MREIRLKNAFLLISIAKEYYLSISESFGIIIESLEASESVPMFGEGDEAEAARFSFTAGGQFVHIAPNATLQFALFH